MTFNEYIDNLRDQMRHLFDHEWNLWTTTNANDIVQTWRDSWGGKVEPFGKSIVENMKPKMCQHEYVNVGFTSRTMICKHCEDAG